MVSEPRSWLAEIAIAAGLVITAAFPLVCMTLGWLVVPFLHLHDPDDRPLPLGYVCAAGDMDTRCPAGKAWLDSGMSATDWAARHP